LYPTSHHQQVFDNLQTHHQQVYIDNLQTHHQLLYNGKVYEDTKPKFQRPPKRLSRESDVPVPSIGIYEVPIPNELTNVAYIPVCEPYVETPADAGIDKFGGKYLYKPAEMTKWPICDVCNKPLTFMFNIKDPLYDPKLDVGDHVQLLMCIDADCSNSEEVALGTPRCKLYRYMDSTVDKAVFEAPASIPCFKIVEWKIKREPEYIDVIGPHIVAVPGIEDKMRDVGGFTTAEWENHVTTRMMGRNQWNIPGESKTTRENVLIDELTDAYYDQVAQLHMISEGFKFGGTPSSITGEEVYDNYIQIAKTPFFPYTWGGTDEYVLHLSRDGTIRGDMDG
jgi:hypothetical protein